MVLSQIPSQAASKLGLGLCPLKVQMGSSSLHGWQMDSSHVGSLRGCLSIFLIWWPFSQSSSPRDQGRSCIAFAFVTQPWQSLVITRVTCMVCHQSHGTGLMQCGKELYKGSSSKQVVKRAMLESGHHNRNKKRLSREGIRGQDSSRTRPQGGRKNGKKK